MVSVTPFRFASRSRIFRRMAFMTAALLAVFALSSTLAAQGTGCADTKYPDPLPTPNALVDSAHAIGDLAAFADPAKPMLFSVYFNAGDSVAHVRALESQDAAASVTLANYVRHAHPGEFWAFRVRLAGGDAPALTIERSKYCPPVPHSGGARGEITGSVASVNVEGMPNPMPIESGSRIAQVSGNFTHLEVLVAIDGKVLMSRLLRPSGNAQLDAEAVNSMKREKFEPARLDGQPIQGVYRSGGESPRP